MIKRFLFWLKDTFSKPKPEVKDHIYLIRKFDSGRYLCLINGTVVTITSDQYKNYLKRNDNTD